MVDALFVRAGVLRDRVARTGLLHAHRHVVLVGTVAAVVDPVAQLVPGDTLVIGALEPSMRVALEVRCAEREKNILSFRPCCKGIGVFGRELTAHGGTLVGIVAAVVGAVADVVQRNADVVVALESRLRAVSSSGVPRWAVDFVAHVAAIPRSVATKIRRDAMTARALEAVVLQVQE